MKVKNINSMEAGNILLKEILLKVKVVIGPDLEILLNVKVVIGPDLV